MKKIIFNFSLLLTIIHSISAFGGVGGGSINIGRQNKLNSNQSCNDYCDPLIKADQASLTSEGNFGSDINISALDIKGISFGKLDRLVINLGLNKFTHVVKSIIDRDSKFIIFVGVELEVVDIIYDTDENPVAIVTVDQYGDQVLLALNR